VRVVPITGERGDRLMESRVGAVFPTVTEAVLVVVAEYPSVAMARHSTTSFGETVLVDNVTVDVVPIVVLVLVLTHSHDIEILPPSGSLAVAVHPKVVDVVIPLLGLMTAAAVKFGGVLITVTVCVM
jgi:hypothetical protein